MPEVVQSPTASFNKKGDRYIFLLKVNVRLFASIRKFSDKDNLEINIEEGSSVKDLLPKIGIPQNQPLLIILNEYTRGKETLLQEGDILCLFPIIAGG